MAALVKKKLPIGIENFEEIRTDGFYYVDKTGLLIELLNNWGKVTLFTRPRRFGKTLNMSMLESFFSPDGDHRVFEGLKIADEPELCEAYMGKYPVLFLSLKSLEGGSYETSRVQLNQLINRAAKNVFRQTENSERLLPDEKDVLSGLMKSDIEEADLFDSLRMLSEILESHYGQKVIILIDEYDVPLAKAYEDGYYDQMVRLIRNLFHQALKTNDSLKFAVLTGCMRISKESIFTGLNNMKVRSISDEEYDEYFGFTDVEVRQILDYYGFSSSYDIVQDWYDGYRFGNASVYCPWDVISYCDKLRTSSDHTPENFWLNSSGNYAVRKFITESGNTSLKGEIEDLINGETVEKSIRQDLTYQDMYTSAENIWSVLYTTGYLTQKGRSGSRLRLAIPNREICNIFSEQILELFKADVRKDGEALQVFCSALENRDIEAAQGCLNDFLKRTISIRDTAVRKSLKENFYHGIMLGILSVKSGWTVTSNQESGDGYSDILIRNAENDLAMVLEIKYADDGDMEATCAKGLQQVWDKNYDARLQEEGFGTILKYGISFRLKKCRIMLAE